MLPLFVIFAPQPFLSLYSHPRSTAFAPFLCFHKVANPSHLIDSEILCFHALVNRYLRNPFVFTSMQIPGGVTPLHTEFLCARSASVACLPKQAPGAGLRAGARKCFC